MAFASQLIVRVYLDRQIVLRVDQLDQQREQQSEMVIDMVADQIAHIDFGQLFEVIAGEFAIGHHRDVTRYGRQFPTFADTFSGGQFFIHVVGEPIAPPDALFEQRLEF